MLHFKDLQPCYSKMYRRTLCVYVLKYSSHGDRSEVRVFGFLQTTTVTLNFIH